MKYKVLGCRVLLKVKKFSDKKDQKFEGSSLIMPEQIVESETTAQTIGEVVQLGSEAYKKQSSPWCKVGDKVHFQRYGAVRVNTKEHEDHEFWVINDIDILCAEEV